MDKEGFLSIGKIVGTHGLKGDLKVYPYTESLNAFDSGHPIVLRNTIGGEQLHFIDRAKTHKRVILLSLKGVTSIDRAESLIGFEIFIETENLPELEEGSYYWFEIIGLSVFTKDNEYIGNVTSVIPTGSNDVYVVNNPDKGLDNEILIPAIETVVLEIDLEQKRMSVDLPAGL